MNKEERNFANNKDGYQTFPVVAIGAAAGGVEALSELLQNLTGETGLAYVYVQHPEDGMERQIKNKLSQLTNMPVVYAEEGMKLMANNLYILPFDQQLNVENNLFEKDKNLSKLYAEMPINRFFISLADSYGGKTIGVLLSGSTTDGVLGLKSIKQAGGFTYTQNESAQFSTLPKAAITANAADLALSPKSLAEELTRLGHKKDIFFKSVNELDENLINNEDEDLQLLFKMLYQANGVDFRSYKMNTIKRRIIRRMMLLKLDSVKDYASFLKQNSSEVSFLFQDLLINVTAFFRDEFTTAYISDVILPAIIKTKGQNDPIRIWVPACSTGQEAYSLAILLLEKLGENLTNIPVQIFATDLSEVAIAKARLGIYSKDEVIGISETRLQRFFIRQDGHYRIIKTLRDVCVFAPHNIAKDPPFSRLDIISCCNLMIYLDNALQKRLMGTFHNSLNSTGYLILGKSESVGNSSYLFSLVDKKLKIYSKKNDAKPHLQYETGYFSPSSGRFLTPTKIADQSRTKSDEVELDKVVDTLLLKKFTPASVVVNYDLDILLFRGSTGLYLEPSPGKASLNLMKMAKSALGFELKNIVHKAKKQGAAVKKEGIELIINDKTKNVTIEAIPLKTYSHEDYYLVVFEEVKPLTDDKDLGPLKDRRVKQLEDELSSLREDMRSIIETQEVVNEELQSANEEIVSNNEELQSINEELETSKEEIESSNEELITINQELQLRNEQLLEEQEYSNALFTFMRESLLILNKELNVKLANSAFYTTFKVLEEDTLGHLLYDLGNAQWNIPELKEKVETLLEDASEFIDFEVVHHFPTIGEKVMLVHGRKIHHKLNNQPLVLLSIEDITQYRQSQKIIAEREIWFRNVADNSPMMIWVTGNDRLCQFVNKTFLEFRNVKEEDVLGKSWLDGVHPDDEKRCTEVYNQSFEEVKPFALTYSLLHKDGRYRKVISKGKPNFTSEGNFTGFIGSCTDVDE